MLRIYLKEDLKGEEFENKLKDAGIETTRDDTRTGRTYVDFFGNPLDPTNEVPEVPEELVDFVTYRDVIYVGFRTEGLYAKHEGTLLVRTQRDVHDPIRGSEGVEGVEGGAPVVHQWQELLVRAPSVEVAIELYKEVRTGSLNPVSDWEREAVAQA